MQLFDFAPRHELIKKHVRNFHVFNYEEKYIKRDVVIYPNYLNTITLQDNFLSRLSKGVFRYREYAPRRLNVNVLGRFTEPLRAEVEGRIKAFSIVFEPGGINFFNGKSLDELAPRIHARFDEWNARENDLRELLYLDDMEELTRKVENILLSFYRPYENDVLFKALELLHGNFAEYSVAELARALGVSRKTLFRQFKRHIGVSVTDYRRILRFREAIRLYPHNENLTKLAYESCFCDQAHFVKDFRKLAGEAPKKTFDEAGYVAETPFFLKVKTR